jgi:hypothetical protein
LHFEINRQEAWIERMEGFAAGANKRLGPSAHAGLIDKILAKSDGEPGGMPDATSRLGDNEYRSLWMVGETYEEGNLSWSFLDGSTRAWVLKANLPWLAACHRGDGPDVQSHAHVRAVGQPQR